MMCMSGTNQAREAYMWTAERGAHNHRLRSIYISRSCNLKRMEFRTLMAGRLSSFTSLLMVRDETDRKSAASSGVSKRTGLRLVISNSFILV